MGDETPRHAFGKRLRFLREARSLTRAALGDRAGVDTTTIKRYELGANSPTLEMLCRLAWGLSCEPAELLENVPPDDSADRGVRRLRGSDRPAPLREADRRGRQGERGEADEPPPAVAAGAP